MGAYEVVNTLMDCTSSILAAGDIAYRWIVVTVYQSLTIAHCLPTDAQVILCSK